MASGSLRTFIVTSVTTPSVPSEPRMKWWMSGPQEMRGTVHDFSITPLGVTILQLTSYVFGEGEEGGG